MSESNRWTNINFDETRTVLTVPLSTLLSSIDKTERSTLDTTLTVLSKKVKKVKDYTLPHFEVYLWKDLSVLDLSADNKIKQAIELVENTLAFNKKTLFEELLHNVTSQQNIVLRISSIFFSYGSEEALWNTGKQDFICLAVTVFLVESNIPLLFHYATSTVKLTGKHLKSFERNNIEVDQLPLVQLLLSFVQSYNYCHTQQYDICFFQNNPETEVGLDFMSGGFTYVGPDDPRPLPLENKYCQGEGRFLFTRTQLKWFLFHGEITRGLLRSQKHPIFLGKFINLKHAVQTRGYNTIPLRQKQRILSFQYVHQDFNHQLTKEQVKRLLLQDNVAKLLTLCLKNKYTILKLLEEDPSGNTGFKSVTHREVYVEDYVLDYCFYCFMAKYEECFVFNVEAVGSLYRDKLNDPNYYGGQSLEQYDIPEGYHEIDAEIQFPTLFYDYKISIEEASSKDLRICIPFSYMGHYEVIVRRWIGEHLYFFYADSDADQEHQIPDRVLFLLANSPLWPLGMSARWLNVSNIRQTEYECGARCFVHGVILLLTDVPENSLDNLATLRKKKGGLSADCRGWMNSILKEQEFSFHEPFLQFRLDDSARKPPVPPDCYQEMMFNEVIYQEVHCKLFNEEKSSGYNNTADNAVRENSVALGVAAVDGGEIVNSTDNTTEETVIAVNGNAVHTNSVSSERNTQQVSIETTVNAVSTTCYHPDSTNGNTCEQYLNIEQAANAVNCTSHLLESTNRNSENFITTEKATCQQITQHVDEEQPANAVNDTSDVLESTNGNFDSSLSSFEYIYEQVWTCARPRIEEQDPCGCTSVDGSICCFDEQCIHYYMHVECGQECFGEKFCCNRRIQESRWKRVETFDSGLKGIGVRALEKIHVDEFVIEYLGEIFQKQMLQSRMEAYEDSKHIYLCSLENDYYIDARVKGNESRFINHSCWPNCKLEKWRIAGTVHSVIVALKDIKIGEEITFSYGWKEPFGNRNPTPCLCMNGDKCQKFVEHPELTAMSTFSMETDTELISDEEIDASKDISVEDPNKELFSYPSDSPSSIQMQHHAMEFLGIQNSENTTEIVSQHRLQDTISITVKDRRSVLPSAWVTDNVVYFWFRWLQNVMSDVGVPTFVYRSTFLKNLIDQGYTAVQNYYPRHDTFTTRMSFFPFSVGHHWSLIVACNLCQIAYDLNISHQRGNDSAFFLYFDSMYESIDSTVKTKFVQWLNIKVRKCLCLNQDYFTDDNCHWVIPSVPKQPNDFDCGIYLCKYALAIFQLKDVVTDFSSVGNLHQYSEFQFTHADIDSCRKQVGRLIDVYAGRELCNDVINHQISATEQFTSTLVCDGLQRIQLKPLSGSELQKRQEQEENWDKYLRKSSVKRLNEGLSQRMSSSCVICRGGLDDTCFQCAVCHREGHQDCGHFFRTEERKKQQMTYYCNHCNSTRKRYIPDGRHREHRYAILFRVSGVGIIEYQDISFFLVTDGKHVETLPETFAYDIIEGFASECQQMQLKNYEDPYFVPSADMNNFLFEMGRCLTSKVLLKNLRTCDKNENTHVKYNVYDASLSLERELIDILPGKDLSDEELNRKAWITVTYEKQTKTPPAPLYFLLRWRTLSNASTVEGHTSSYDDMFNTIKQQYNRWVKIEPGTSRMNEETLQIKDWTNSEPTKSKIKDESRQFKNGLPKSFRYQPFGEQSCVFTSLVNAFHYINDDKGRDFILEHLPLSLSSECYRQFSSNRISFAAYVVNQLKVYQIDKIVDFQILTDRSMWPTLCVLQGSDFGINHAVTVVESYIFDGGCKTAMELKRKNLDWCCGTGTNSSDVRFFTVETAYRFTRRNPGPMYLLREPSVYSDVCTTMIKVMQYIRDFDAVSALATSRLVIDKHIFDSVREALRKEGKYVSTNLDSLSDVLHYGGMDDRPIMLLLHFKSTFIYFVIGIVGGKIFYSKIKSAIPLLEINLIFFNNCETELIKGYLFTKRTISRKRKPFLHPAAIENQDNRLTVNHLRKFNEARP